MLELPDEDAATVVSYAEFEADHSHGKAHLDRTAFAKERDVMEEPLQLTVS